MDPSVNRKVMGSFIPWYIPYVLVRHLAYKQVYYSGHGRHTPEEVQRIGRADLKALKTFLGKSWCGGIQLISFSTCSNYFFCFNASNMYLFLD